MKNRTLLLILAALLLTACGGQPTPPIATQPASDAPLGAMAAEYVRLVLAWANHDEAIDVYFGPEALEEEAAQISEVSTIRERANALHSELRSLRVAPEDATRQRFLLGQVQGLCTRIQVVSGETLPYWEEHRLVYGSGPLTHDLAAMDAVRQQLSTLLPGEGPLHERYFSFLDRVVVPRDKLQHVIELAFDEARRRTREKMDLPPSESVSLNFVTGKRYRAYQEFKANATSVIHVNLDLPWPITWITELGPHETYPGHHAHYVNLERLYRQTGWVELSVIAIHAPMVTLIEGIGEMAPDVLFSADQRLAYEREVIYPAAGLDPALAEKGARVRELVRALAPARIAIQVAHKDGQITKEQARERLIREALKRPKAADKSLATLEQWGTFDAVYPLGLELVGSYVDREAGADTEKRWAAFEQVLRAVPMSSALVLAERPTP